MGVTGVYKQGMEPAPKQADTRVLIADDHELVRAGIKAMLGTAAGIELVGEAASGEQLLSLVERLKPDVVLTDIQMPGLGGLEAIAHIHRDHPEVRVLVFSSSDTLDAVATAVGKGACGYLMKDAPLEIEHAVRTVVSTGSYFSPAIASLLRQAGMLEILEGGCGGGADA